MTKPRRPGIGAHLDYWALKNVGPVVDALGYVRRGRY